MTTESNDSNSAAIAALNDAFRRGKRLDLGRVVASAIVAALPERERSELMEAVRTSADCGKHPHSEHALGCVTVRRIRYLWKIDYYDASLEYGHEDPTATDCVRVLTVMEDWEY